jgi:hypothetical protein
MMALVAEDEVLRAPDGSLVVNGAMGVDERKEA